MWRLRAGAAPTATDLFKGSRLSSSRYGVKQRPAQSAGSIPLLLHGYGTVAEKVFAEIEKKNEKITARGHFNHSDSSWFAGRVYF